MLAVSTALQMSLRAQQRYARLAARGDEVLNRRRPSDEPPSWATFDDPVDQLSAVPPEEARAAGELLDELLGAEPAEDPAAGGAVKKVSPATSASRTANAAARKTAARKAPARRAADDDPADKGKTVSKPRHTSPSRFDAIDDD
jgi:hypothetical protein